MYIFYLLKLKVNILKKISSCTSGWINPSSMSLNLRNFWVCVTKFLIENSVKGLKIYLCHEIFDRKFLGKPWKFLDLTKIFSCSHEIFVRKFCDRPKIFLDATNFFRCYQETFYQNFVAYRKNFLMSRIFWTAVSKFFIGNFVTGLKNLNDVTKFLIDDFLTCRKMFLKYTSCCHELLEQKFRDRPENFLVFRFFAVTESFANYFVIILKISGCHDLFLLSSQISLLKVSWG